METKEKPNLYLVGYMGTGKTTVGKLMAKKLNRSFTDVDEFIESRYNQTIASIFEERGEAGFREIEHRALQEICKFENAVVSTGGGLPCFFDNMDVMNRTGITIYLKASAEDLLHRISFNKQKRPLTNGKNPEELQNFVEANLKKREPFYNQARLIIDVPHCSTKEGVNQWVDDFLIENAVACM